MSTHRSAAYIQHLKQGPFPGRIDSFAETGHYFQQIHSGIIYELQLQLQEPLVERGYQAGKEASLQIVARREPDIFIVNTVDDRPFSPYTYPAAATELDVEGGVALLDAADPTDEDALHIRDIETGDLVTVVEVVSPRNKSHTADVTRYRNERFNLFLAQGINVVEIDPTRSPHRLIDSHKLEQFPYHTAVHIPGEPPYAIINLFDEPLKPFALPLRGEVIRVEPQAAYDRAYQTGLIASHIQQGRGYIRDRLPYPTTMTEAQIAEALHTMALWQEKLASLV